MIEGKRYVDIDFDFFWDKSIDGKEKPKPTVPERVQAKFQVYTSGGGDGLNFKFTAADGSHSFEVKADDFVDNGPAVEINVNLKPNINYVPTPKKIRDGYQYYTKAKMSNLRQAGYKKDFLTIEQGVKDYIKNYLIK